MMAYNAGVDTGFVAVSPLTECHANNNTTTNYSLGSFAMRRIIFILAVFVPLAFLFCATATAAEGPKKISVLLIAGDDLAPAHNWRKISEATRDVLINSGRFDVRVCEDPMILESKKALDRYDVIVFTMFNSTLPTISDEAKANLLEFVTGGKGFYVQHLASKSFKEWEGFGKLCGRKWIAGISGHGPRKVFEAKITDTDHPITKGMKNFKVSDELYAKLQGDSPINVLVTGDSEWSKKTEPLLFTLQYGRGRVVHNAFGHDTKAINNADVQRLIARGVEWAATGSVADADSKMP